MSQQPRDDSKTRWTPLDGLHKLLEHRLRLGICVLLARQDRITFSRLKELLGETDGNLGANLRKLEDHGLIRVHKEFLARKPVSWYSLEVAGRTALAEHLAALSQLIQEAQLTDRES